MLVSGLFAALSAVGGGQLAGIAAAVSFSVGACAAVWIYIERPERVWYEARAIAESVKTLAWQYAVGGGRFPCEAVESRIDEGFVNALRELLETGEVAILPRRGPHITEAMRTLRTADPDTRRTTYRDDRLEEQRAWYERNARWNRRQGERWRVAMIALQLAGVAVSIVAVFVTYNSVIGLVGLLATAAAAAVAWHQTRDHETLAEAYSITAHELSLVKERVPTAHSEPEWTEFVRNAEQAISREHTLWRARRSRPIAPLSRDRSANDGA